MTSMKIALLLLIASLTGCYQEYNPNLGAEVVQTISQSSVLPYCLYYTKPTGDVNSTYLHKFFSGAGVFRDYAISDTCEKFKIGDTLKMRFYK